ncbi:MAG: UDP-N-acetylmuramate--L-alanine ligase [Planctomycetota bacterium]
MTALPLRVDTRVKAAGPSGLPGEALVKGKHVHFMGIGGVGVSGLARLADAAGAVVSGCDVKLGPKARAFAGEGKRIAVGHSPDHLDGVDILVHTGAVRPAEPELVAARARGIEVIDRLPMLVKLAEGRRFFGIAGSHGKTTTTTLSAALLIEAGLDPSVAVGGASDAVGGNARAGRGEWFIAEVDESDGLIADAACELVILTNVDREHFDHYDGFEAICRTFGRFLANTPEKGAIVACADSAAALSLARNSGRHVISYGLGDRADFRAESIRLEGDGSRFDIATPSGAVRDLFMGMPGVHNVQNAIAVAAAASHIGIADDALRRALGAAPNIERRLESHDLPRAAKMIVDYAHHPAKVAALVAAVRLFAPGRVIAVFQPHRYTRTKHLGADFGPAFAGKAPAHLPGLDARAVDELIVLPIYAASEDAIAGVTGEVVADSARRAGVEGARYVESREEALSHLLVTVREGDTVLLVGAGDVNALADELASRL